MKLLFIFIGFFLKFSTQQVFPVQEMSLNVSNKIMMDFELSLRLNLTKLNAFVKFSSSNLKAINITSNLSSILDQTFITIGQLSTIDNHRIFYNLTGSTVCDYVDIRKSFVDLEMRKFHSIIFDIQANFTKLYENFNLITFNYASNLRTLAMNWSRERNLVLTFKQTLLTFNEYFEYIGILKNDLENFGKFHKYLNQLKCTISNSTFANAGNKIEASLKQCEEQLKKKEEIAVEKINLALTTVSSSSAPVLKSEATPSNQKFYLNQMKFDLNNFLTVNDYPALTWPHIPDYTGEFSYKSKVTLRSSQEKKDSYERIWDNHLQNRTKLEEDKNDLDLGVQSSRKTRSLNPAIDDVSVAATDVVNQFSTCMVLLNKSIAQVDLMISDAEEKLKCGL